MAVVIHAISRAYFELPSSVCEILRNKNSQNIEWGNILVFEEPKADL